MQHEQQQNLWMKQTEPVRLLARWTNTQLTTFISIPLHCKCMFICVCTYTSKYCDHSHIAGYTAVMMMVMKIMMSVNILPLKTLIQTMHERSLDGVPWITNSYPDASCIQSSICTEQRLHMHPLKKAVSSSTIRFCMRCYVTSTSFPLARHTHRTTRRESPAEVLEL